VASKSLINVEKWNPCIFILYNNERGYRYVLTLVAGVCVGPDAVIETGWPSNLHGAPGTTFPKPC
jgi:hypothetical protein